MRRNKALAVLTAVVITLLTILISLSPNMLVIVLGAAILVTGFGLLARLERFSGPVSNTSRAHYYVIPLVIGPSVGGLLRDVPYGPLAGIVLGVLCGAAAYLLIMKFPPFEVPQADEEDYVELRHH